MSPQARQPVRGKDANRLAWQRFVAGTNPEHTMTTDSGAATDGSSRLLPPIRSVSVFVPAVERASQAEARDAALASVRRHPNDDEAAELSVVWLDDPACSCYGL